MKQGTGFYTENGQTIVMAQYNRFRDGVSIIFRSKEPGYRKRVAVITGIEWIEVGEGQEYPSDTLCLPQELALQLQQELNRALGDAGIKSDTQSAMEGELKATKYHLEDMRTLAMRGKK